MVTLISENGNIAAKLKAISFKYDVHFWNVMLCIRGIRTITKLRLLTKIDFNIMHLVSLCKKIWQKLQIRGSRDLQFLAISDIFFQILRILCSKNAFNWFWSTKFAYRRKNITKNSYSEFPAAVGPKLRPGIVVKFGGCLSHEFAIFANFFCIDLLNALHWSLF